MGKKGVWGVREVGVRRLYVMGSATLREAAKVYGYCSGRPFKSQRWAFFSRTDELTQSMLIPHTIPQLPTSTEAMISAESRTTFTRS
jgi:hypothetical protein